eukprot:2424044-Pyramimonas_sp.AAC.1
MPLFAIGKAIRHVQIWSPGQNPWLHACWDLHNMFCQPSPCRSAGRGLQRERYILSKSGIAVEMPGRMHKS